MSTTTHHRVVIIGRHLRRTHYFQPHYQPLWTLVGGGCAPAKESLRSEASVMPADINWIRDRAEGVDPHNRTVTTAGGAVVG